MSEDYKLTSHNDHCGTVFPASDRFIGTSSFKSKMQHILDKHFAFPEYVSVLMCISDL